MAKVDDSNGGSKPVSSAVVLRPCSQVDFKSDLPSKTKPGHFKDSEGNEKSRGSFSRSYPVFEGVRYENPWERKSAPPPRDLDEDEPLNGRPRSRIGVMCSFFCSRLCGCRGERVPGNQELDAELPVSKIKFDNALRKLNDPLELTWIGHATSLVRMDGISMITDPIFSNYCSPVPIGGTRRLRPTPCSISDLPEDLRLVLISHNHYDHLDNSSIVKLHRRYGGLGVRFCVPEGLAKWFHSNLSGVRDHEITELTWWQTAHFETAEGALFKVTAVPAQHWSLRVPGNGNHSLWCGWVVEGPSGRKFYFSGDTGYCPGFKEIGAELGPIDLCAIPIGAYKPRQFLFYAHVDPWEAVQIHCDVQSKQSVGVHWGTFSLGGEKTLDPRADLARAVKEKQLDPQKFVTLPHGGTLVV